MQLNATITQPADNSVICGIWWKRRRAELEYEVGVRNTESKLMFKNESEEDGVSLQDSQKIAQIVLKRVIDQ